jgi:hypothetical protein
MTGDLNIKRALDGDGMGRIASDLSPSHDLRDVSRETDPVLP